MKCINCGESNLEINDDGYCEICQSMLNTKSNQKHKITYNEYESGFHTGG